LSRKIPKAIMAFSPPVPQLASLEKMLENQSN
jgi:hypothetical protein